MTLCDLRAGGVASFTTQFERKDLLLPPRFRIQSASGILTALALALFACAPATRLPTARAEAIPVFREPRHRVAYAEALVRILDVRVQPGDTTLFHVHADHHIGVVIAGARTWTQRLGEVGSVRERDSVGSLLDNSKDSLPYTHRVANVDSVAFRYITGQFLGVSGIAAAPLSNDPTIQLDRETSRGSIYRIFLRPGEATGTHRHAQPGLTVQIGAGTLSMDGTSPAATSQAIGAGAWWWRSAGHTHAIRNIGKVPIQLVEIDWK